MNYRFLFQTKNVDEEIYYSGKGGRVVMDNGDDWGHDGDDDDDDGEGDVWVGGVIKIPAPHVTVLRLVVSGLTSVIRAHSV